MPPLRFSTARGFRADKNADKRSRVYITAIYTYIITQGAIVHSLELLMDRGSIPLEAISKYGQFRPFQIAHSAVETNTDNNCRVGVGRNVYLDIIHSEYVCLDIMLHPYTLCISSSKVSGVHLRPPGRVIYDPPVGSFLFIFF